MRPFFERVTIASGESWTLYDRRLPSFPFNWHYHPEYELTLTLNSLGERFVGDHVTHYDDGDLVLVGPNLAHAWQSRAACDPEQPHRALVFWFTRQWAEGLTLPYPELGSVGSLLAESARGLCFSQDTAARVQSKMLALVDAAPATRWLGLVEILLTLAADPHRQPLAMQGFTADLLPRERARLERVLSYLHENYAQPVRLAALAELASTSESQLQRVFKRCTRVTVSDYLAQLRIGRACALLLDRAYTIAQVAEAAGFGQQSYFTRQFRALKGMTPTEFRRRFGGIESR